MTNRLTGPARLAAIAAAALLVTTSAATAQVCVFAIIAKALYASAAENRELTQKEAMTCGIFKGDDDASAQNGTKAGTKPVTTRARPRPGSARPDKNPG